MDRLGEITRPLLETTGDQFGGAILTVFVGPKSDALLSAPDHLAFKVADPRDYRSCARSLLELSQLGYGFETRMDNRRIATFKLKDPVRCGALGFSHYVELIEIRPENIDKDKIGPNHAEIVYPKIDVAQTTLDSEGIPYRLEGNQSHQWISVLLNAQSPEVKLTDRRLEDIIKDELRQGKAWQMW